MNTTNTSQRLVWLDLEMSGLEIVHDKILEIATIITDSQLNVIAEGPVFAIHQTKRTMNHMDAWNTRTHKRSGLIERVLNSYVDEKHAEHETLKFIKRYVKAQASPLCGNTVHQDRLFLKRFMPALERNFHYRNLDVSTLKILTQMWAPNIYKKLDKEPEHTALQDIKDSIAELKFYREHILKI
jgi:oligoribonuclease